MSRRLQRLNTLLRQELADLIRTELRDPRLADIVSITRVDISPDLKNAKIYASVLGDEEAKTATMKALAAADRAFIVAAFASSSPRTLA